jgi:hypothetical protein
LLPRIEQWSKRRIEFQRIPPLLPPCEAP